ncbi:DUF3139 domain-containing protein [Listeria sp. PSOL-1]|uniref:DUF3139 domain-containing protein n=1 Tax=Listeria sp. PSOL-1 TaxID=1844999 RepID=UPI0013D68D6A|nr:DUF3139 domain-containing protein [Listeria sp. PSOL-1]
MKKIFLWAGVPVGIIILIGMIFYIYQVPVQKYFGKKAIEKYITAQQINRKDMQLLDSGASLMKGGYRATYKIKTDPEKEYSYYYRSWAKSDPYHISLNVYKNGTALNSSDPSIKHPPLSDDFKEK